MINFFSSTFWQDFFPNALATLLGVLFALWFDRRIARTRERHEALRQQAAKVQVKTQFLGMMRESLLKNLSLVEQMEAELKPNYVIFYNVDTQQLEATASLKYDLIDDLDLNRRLDSIRYELLHFHRKVELQLDIEYGAYKAMQNYMERRTQLVNAITAHIPRIKQEIHDVLSIINTNEKVGNAMPDNIDNERLNRLWLHGLHEDKIFNDRLSFFLVFESILLAVVGMLYSDPAQKTIVLLAIMILGLVTTIVWGLIQIQQKLSLDIIKARVIELDPDYRKTVEIRDKARIRFSVIWILAYFIPTLVSLIWIVLLVTLF